MASKLRGLNMIYIIVSLIVFTLLTPVMAIGADQQASPAAVDGRCTGANDVPGVCIATASCKENGGQYISGACPGTPDDIKCCTKSKCGTTGIGCKWTSDCTGSALSGLCPGPSGFKCCFPPDPHGNLPGLNSAQSVHARVIISRVKQMAGIADDDRRRACLVTMVTARQESSILVLANKSVPESMSLPYDGVGSDHDSVGIFQQRDSWGTAKDRMDPVSVIPKHLKILDTFVLTVGIGQERG